MDVRLPDGRILKNVPEGTTKAQIAEKLGLPLDAQEQQAPAQSPPNLAQRIANNWQSRVQQVANIPATDTMASQGLQTLGAGMGAIKDIGGDIVGTALSSVMPEKLMQHLAHGGFATPGMPIQNLANAVAPKAQQAYDTIAPQGTEIRRNLDALGNVASVESGVLTGIKPAVETALNAPKAAKALITPLQGRSLQAKIESEISPKLTREEVTAAKRKSASAGYKKSEAENIQFDDETINNLNSSLETLKPKEDMQLRVWGNSQAAKEVQDIQDSIAIEKPSFNGLLAKRKDINSRLKVAARAGNDTDVYHLEQVKEALDRVMMNENTGTWQKANHEWAQQAILDDFDEMTSRAGSKAQPANSLDTAIVNYLHSYKSNSLTNAEWEALADVANNSNFDKLRKGAASGLIKYTTSMIGSHAGPPGAAAGYLFGHYASEFAKDAAGAAKLKKLDKVREMILNRKPPSTYPVGESMYEPPKNVTKKSVPLNETIKNNKKK